MAVLGLLFLLAACKRELDLPAVDGFIAGRVLESEEPGARPLAGVTVSVQGSNLATASDAQGLFAVGPMPGGTYRVLLDRRDPTTGDRRWRLFSGVQARGGATVSLGDVSLRQSAQVTGRVLLAGRERGNAGVIVFAPGLGEPATTRDDGSYLLRGLPEGEFQIEAFRSGYLPGQSTTLSVHGGLLNTATDLILPLTPPNAPPGGIAGSVLVTDRADSSGVMVSAFRAGVATAGATAVTASDGSFTLPGLPTDLWRLHFTLTGYPPADAENVPVAPGVTRVLARIVLTAPGPDNTGADAGAPPDAGPPPDAGSPDAGPPPDGGTIGAQCNVDSDCASGRLCVQNFCVGCSTDVGCRPGFSCRAGDCVRSCTSDADCAGGQICTLSTGLCGPCVTNADCHSAALVCFPDGTCGHCRSRADCPAGLACFATGCGVCAQDSDCGGVGNLCQNGQCISGNCHTSAACDPKVCVGFQCVSCTGDSQCPLGRLCLPAASGNTCQPANCRTSSCSTGQPCVPCPSSTPICSSNQCGVCTADAQCAASNVICLGGLCVSGNCHDATACSGGQICNAQHFCAPCGVNADCGTGSVCDHGSCKAGNCVSTADCTGANAGKYCNANVCTSCTASSQCPSGTVCISPGPSGTCTAGNCVVDADCSTNHCNTTTHYCQPCDNTGATGPQGGCAAGNVCDANGHCTPGNCTRTSDCTTSGTYNGQVCVSYSCQSCTGYASLCPGTTGCVNGACAPCTASTQCAAGKVCDGLTPGHCVAGNCAPDVACTGTPSPSCVNFTCQQTTPTYGGESAPVPGGAFTSGSPSPVYGSSSVFAVPGQYPPVGEHLVAYDPATLASRFTPVAGTSYQYLNLSASVVPARGFPGDELVLAPFFVFPNGSGLLQSFAGGNGAPFWSATVAQYGDAAVGIADGQVTVVWTYGAQLLAVHADGTAARLNGLALPCSPSHAPVFGTKMLYVNCSNTLLGIDPAATTLAVTWHKDHVLADGTTTTTFSDWSPIAIYRSPPSASYDLVIFLGRIPSPAPPAPPGQQVNLYALRVDDTAGVNPPARIYTVALGGLPSGTVDATVNGTPSGLVLDAAGTAYMVSSTGGWAKVKLDGTISSGATGAGFNSSYIALQSDGSVVGFNGAGQLQAVTLPDTGAPKLNWQITSPAGTLWNQTWPGISPTGLLHAWAEPNGAGSPFVLTVYRPAGGLTFPAAPAWPVHGGTAANQNRAPNYGCTSDSACTVPAACVLGQCIGNCRSRADCTAGGSHLGCVAALCTTCVSDNSCASGEWCSDGACFPACSGVSCCHTSADCGSPTKVCLNTQCVDVPSPTAASSWLRNDFPPLYSTTFQISEGSDGLVYAIYRESPTAANGNTYNVKLAALDSAGNSISTGSWTSPSIMLSPLNTYSTLPAVLVTTLAGQTTDTLFWASNWSGVALTYAVTGGTSGGQVVSKYQGSLYPATRLSSGLYCATGAPLASCLPATNLKQALFFVTTGAPFIAAYDATALAQGPSCTATTGCNPPIIWQGPLAAGCAVTGDWPPLVGSDGTVYFVCANGQVYAFDPSGAAGLAKSLANYPATPPGTFNNSYGAPLLYKGSSGDVLSYGVYDSTNGVDCPVSIPVSAAGPGTISVAPASACLTHGSRFNLVADAAGYLYFQDGQIAVYPPNLSGRLGTLPSLTTGQSLELGSDGILYAIRGTQLAAVQIIPNHGLQTLWSIYGPGGFSYDYNSTATLLPGPRLLSDASNSTTGYTRSLTGEALSTSPAGLAPSPAWPTIGGDFKRRFSLKPQ